MEQYVTDAFSDEIRLSVFESAGFDATRAVDLGGFENFVFGIEDRVLRITHSSHRTMPQIEAELDFVGLLGAQKCAVASPLPLPGGKFTGQHGDFYFCQFERAQGEPAHSRPFSSALANEWGRNIGQFHRVSREHRGAQIRPTWVTDENHNFERRIPIAQTRVRVAGEKLLQTLGRLSTHPDHFGLIHSDAHAGNFLCRIEDGRVRLTFFDFDDCLHAWYGYDLATIVFWTAMQPSVPNDAVSMRNAVADFLAPFLAGYRTENNIECLSLQALPLLLKLREFSLYSAITQHLTPSLAKQPQVVRFLAGRQERLEGEVPYLDLDFTAYTSNL